MSLSQLIVMHSLVGAPFLSQSPHAADLNGSAPLSSSLSLSLSPNSPQLVGKCSAFLRICRVMKPTGLPEKTVSNSLYELHLQNHSFSGGSITLNPALLPQGNLPKWEYEPSLHTSGYLCPSYHSILFLQKYAIHCFI